MKRAVCVVWLVAILFFLGSCTGRPVAGTDPAAESVEEESTAEAVGEDTDTEVEKPAEETATKAEGEEIPTEAKKTEEVKGEEPVVEGEGAMEVKLKGSLDGYKIKPGDILNIDPGRFTELKTQARVDDKGYIKLVYVGRIKVSGFTKWEVEDLLEKEFKPYFVNLKITIEILNLKYTIGGEVRTPGQKVIQGDVRLTEAIEGAGGYTSWSKKTAVTIRRKGADGKAKIFKFNCQRIEDGKDEDPFIMPDDIINVPR